MVDQIFLGFHNFFFMFQARHHDLEQSIRHSTVKINFEKSDELLSSLKADNDTIFMKLASSLDVSLSFKSLKLK